MKRKAKHDRVRLSNDYVGKLKQPGTYWDNDVKAVGFGIRLYHSGARSFFVNYWADGVEKRLTIGAFPRWSVGSARERAIELRRMIDAGADPAGQKRERRSAATVQDLVDRYIADHLAKRSLDKARIKDEHRMLGLIADALGRHSKCADIHGGDIRHMHEAITKNRGPVRANRILACCSKMFSLSLVPLAGETLPWRHAVLGNPCRGVERNREHGRERFFNKVELEAIADSLTLYPPEADRKLKKVGQAAANAVRLIMLTGCRPDEARRAEWSEFDKEPGFWIKPSHHTKQRRIHRVPLSPPAIQLVERLRKDRTGKFVFPGRTAGEPIATLDHVWVFVRDRAKLKPDEQGNAARLYDLRHSFASLGVTQKLGLPLIGRLLGHTESRTTQRYAHVADDPLQEAADKIGAAIAGTNGGAEVVKIHGGGAS
jgi:integrase